MRSQARKAGVRVYEYATVGNHIHMVVRARCRAGFQTFLRAFAGIAARLVTGARRGRPTGRFWDTLAYSRVLHWGREFRRARDYVLQNELEALGVISYQPRSKRRSTKSTSQVRLE
jgi:hypothetical protein